MRTLEIPIIVILALLAPVATGAWVYDTHYHLTFAGALSTCFDWDEAHVIASANFMIDKNKATKAESSPFAKSAKRDWHAFGHSTERYTELWTRVLDESDPALQLVKFGQFLHFLQDWESHAGFGLSLGHAIATVNGNDPDSMARSRQRTESQFRSTLDHMAQLCAHLARLPEETRDTDEAMIELVGQFYVDRVLEDLIVLSNPAWRKGKTGGLNPVGKRILALNAARIAAFVEEYLKPRPGTNVPVDFRANSAENSIPKWLRLDFDRHGNVTTAIEAAWGQESEALDEEDLSSVLRILEARHTADGWRVKVRGHNIGDVRSAKGELVVMVSDAESGEEVGRKTLPIPELDPGEKIYFLADVSTPRSAEHALVSATATVDDFTALDSFNLFITEEDLRALEQERLARQEEQARIEEQTEIEIGLVGAPRVWITSDRWLCSVVVARAAHDDPTRVLDPMEVELVGTEGESKPIPDHNPRWWSLTATGRAQPPAVKSYACFPPIDYCPLIGEGPQFPSLRFRLEAGAGEQGAIVPLEGRLARDALRACRTARELGFPENVIPVSEPDHSLRVITLNVWHGLRSGESNTKFPGEDPDRNQRRFNWQVSEIARHLPDVLLLQEVNPAPKESRAYAAVFGYDEIHKVASCGIHLGAVLKIPKNVNEGLTILARPHLELRRIGTKRLSGDAACTGTLGFQTKESRYVLLGQITIEGRPVLLAVTHLSSPRTVPPGFEEDLQRLVEQGKVTEEQQAEIVAKLESGRARNLMQVERLMAEIDKQRERLATDDWLPPVILAGDFNAEPTTPGIQLLEENGWTNVGTGPDFLTWDPVTSHENHEIGTRRSPPVPTFDIPEIEELLEPRYETPRQIDYIFIKGNAKVLTAEMVMNEDQDGLFPSDHFGILSRLDWMEPPTAP